MSTAVEPLERLLLKEELTQFLYREASLLDDRRFEEWLELLTDDVRYVVPMRMNLQGRSPDDEGTQPDRDICWFDEGKETLVQRVEQLQTGMHWAEEPPSRVSRLITNIEIQRIDLPEATVRCRFLYHRNRIADETDLIIGSRRDTLRRVDDGWKLCHRHVRLDQTVLLAKNLTVFL